MNIKHIEQKYNGITTKLVPILYSVLVVIIRHAHTHGYRRHGDDIYRRHKTIPSVYERYEDGWTYMRDLCQGNYDFPLIKKSKLMEWWTSVQDKDFKIISEFDMTRIGFRNGTYNLTTEEFDMMYDPNAEAVAIQCDVDYSEELADLPTPNFDYVQTAYLHLIPSS